MTITSPTPEPAADDLYAALFPPPPPDDHGRGPREYALGFGDRHDPAVAVLEQLAVRAGGRWPAP